MLRHPPDTRAGTCRAGRPPRWAALAAALCLLGAATWTRPGGAEGREATIATPRPREWMPVHGRQCRHTGRYRKLCDGPRRTPVPHGEAADRAERLKLGTRATAGKLLRSGPRPAWVQAVHAAPRRSLLWPVPDGHLGRGFGYTRKTNRKKLHEGIDIGAVEGAFVRAVNDGLIAYSDNGLSGYGNAVLVVHADRSFSLYAHQRANYVFAGQRVRRGQVLGEVGQTGIAWGPHLHFEWHRGGRPRNPLPRMVDRPGRHHLPQM